MNKLFIVLITIILSFQGVSQNPTDSTDQIYTVLDKDSQEPVPYATLYNSTTGTGTVTNLMGQFNWGVLNTRDVLTLSFIGYTSQIFTIKNPIPAIIYLQPKTEILQSAFVYGNMTFLYHLISKCKEPRSSKTQLAKTYFTLESKVENQPIENLESYYNGYFSGYNCQELKIKTGRLAITNFGDRYFLSLETSKALNLHHLFYSGSHFPTSPLGMRKKKLAKFYTLQFVKSYLDDHNHTIYQINYTPKKACDDCFHGTLWVDSLQHQIQKAVLITDRTNKHPFAPWANARPLLHVSLEITKNYNTSAPEVQFISTDFNYQVKFKANLDSINDTLLTINTHALLFAYDYQNTFKLPLFDFSRISYRDYSIIGLIPYNPYFWNKYDAFKMGKSKNISNLFLSNTPGQTGIFIRSTNFHTNQFIGHFFGRALTPWGTNRIKMMHGIDGLAPNNTPIEAPPSQQYHLETQIFMDVNEFNDSLHITTVSYFDRYESFFYLPQTPNTDAFVNMYFDLTEIKRRELVKLTKKATSQKQVEDMYQKGIRDLELQHKSFIKETQRGYRVKGMKKWNDFILKRLQIDNVALFRLLDEDT